MTTTEINRLLHRNIKTGVKYNKYFNSSSCKVVPLANGDTKVAIQQMQKWAYQYAHQCKQIAQVLKKSTLKAYVSNIHQFLYWHIQYSIDGENQNLKSPDCAWQTRKIGTDCKSYSIFASCILLSAGVKHYLRRIKQPNIMENAFTHVYVVIPTNQDTANLSEGYLTLDATTNNNIEVPFTQTHDVYMEPKLPINGLAFTWSDIGGLFNGNASCWGGTYDKPDYEKFAQLVTNAFDSMYYPLNDTIRSLRAGDIQDSVNEIIKSSRLLLVHTTNCANYDWNSACSRDTTKGFKSVAQYFHDVTTKALLPFLDKYFTYRTTEVSMRVDSYSFPTQQGGSGMKKNEFGGFNVKVDQLEGLTLKSGVTTIPKFEFTPYMLEKINTSGFDFNSFLETLVNVGVNVAGGNTGTGTGTATGNGTVTVGDNQNPNAGGGQVQQAGTSTAQKVIVGGLLASALWFGYKKYMK